MAKKRAMNPLLSPLPLSNPVYWRDAAGKPLTCEGKRKVLDANLAELAQQYRDAMDDALLLGCSESSFRDAVQRAFTQVRPTVKERNTQD